MFWRCGMETWRHELKNLMLLVVAAIMMHFFGEPHNSDQANYH